MSASAPAAGSPRYLWARGRCDRLDTWLTDSALGASVAGRRLRWDTRPYSAICNTYIKGYDAGLLPFLQCDSESYAVWQYRVPPAHTVVAALRCRFWSPILDDMIWVSMTYLADRCDNFTTGFNRSLTNLLNRPSRKLDILLELETYVAVLPPKKTIRRKYQKRG